MPKLLVKGLEKHEWGETSVRLNCCHREGIDRYGIAKIINSNEPKKNCLVVLLGHDDRNSVYMAYDTRTDLGVRNGEELDFLLEKAGFLEKMRWYITNRNPMIHIPALLAVWSVVLGSVGIIFGIISIVLSYR